MTAAPCCRQRTVSSGGGCATNAVSTAGCGLRAVDSAAPLVASRAHVAGSA